MITPNIDQTGKRYIRPRYRKWTAGRANELLLTRVVLETVKHELHKIGDSEGVIHVNCIIDNIDRTSDRLYERAMAECSR